MIFDQRKAKVLVAMRGRQCNKRIILKQLDKKRNEETIFFNFSRDFSCFFAAFSTEQIPDRLIIGKDTIYLKTFPLDYLRVKYKIRKAPFDYGGGWDFPYTVCYRGYVATWQTIDDFLTLNTHQRSPEKSTIPEHVIWLPIH